MKAMRFCTPSAKLVFDRRRKIEKAEDLGTVELEVLYRKKRRWVSTGVRVRSHEWDERRSRVKNRGDMLAMNEKLSGMMAKVEEVFVECQRRGVEFEHWMSDEALKGRDAGKVLDEGECGQWMGRSFLEWIEERTDERKDLRTGTLATHRCLVTMLERYNRWCGEKDGGKGRTRERYRIEKFKDLTKPNVLMLDEYLHGLGYKQTTVYGYHKRLKRYANEAVRMEMLKENPYDRVKLARGKSEGVKYLSMEDLEKIRTAEIGQETIRKVRDLFVFQCWTGLAYADMARFDFGRCEERNGRWWLADDRVKSDERYQILLMEPAMEVLRRYGMRLPVITNQQYNLRLKVLGEMLGIKLSLTTHKARHSFAVMALRQGVKIETLAKMMGHTQIQTTQVYAKVLGEQVEEAFLEMEEKMKGAGVGRGM